MQINNLRSLIFDSDFSFTGKAERIFCYQAENNTVFKTFIDKFGFSANSAPAVNEIPLLPVRAFKEARISTQPYKAALHFESSGTSSMQKAVHEVPDPDIYRESIRKGFEYFYPGNPIIFAFLPGYTDNPHSSLVWMLNSLVNGDESGLSCFIDEKALPDFESDRFGMAGRRIILFGAAFGLLDLVEKNSIRLPENSIIIETGGMKTHRREIDREKLHEILSVGFHVPVENIHSEYGMCEMLSQAYSVKRGLFETVPWLKLTIRDPDNPGRICEIGEEGLIGIIDLANLYSCAFLLTGDRGVEVEAGRYRILGRWSPTDMRGCNFLIDRD
jgi:hypothetical protein